MTEAKGDIGVEVVFAEPDRQCLVALSLPAGSTVDDALAASGFSTRFAEFDFAAAALGVWGREAGRHRLLVDGDRVEVYRPLQIDPREARRQLALAGETMRSAESD